MLLLDKLLPVNAMLEFLPHPGSILKLHYLKLSGISVTDLAKELRFQM